MARQTLQNTPVRGERVLVRVDFNVPLRDGVVADDTRLQAALPTIRRLVEQDNAVVLMSHLGRPKGRHVPELSLAPVSVRLAELLGRPVGFVTDCVGEVVESRARALGAGDVLLIENLRFHAEETDNDSVFARGLAALTDRSFINDAFGTAHRAHASTVGVTAHVDRSLAGLLMEKELDYLLQLMASPARPYAAVLGGAKVSGKLEVIESLLSRVDTLVLGGAMMFTFLVAKGVRVGRSLVENDLVETASRVLADAGERGVRVVLPEDCRVASGIDGRDPGRVVPVTAIGDDVLGVDIGPKTIAAIEEALCPAETIVWNGPMGVFEVPAYAEGTMSVARLLAARTRAGATTVIGGGDSAAAVAQSGLSAEMSHVSTGGGAALELLEGKTLPGVAALSEWRP